MDRPTEPQWQCHGCHGMFGAKRKWFRVEKGFRKVPAEGGVWVSRPARLCDYCYAGHNHWRRLRVVS